MNETIQRQPPLASATVMSQPRWRWLMWPFAILGALAAVALVWLMVVLFNLGGGHREQVVMAKAGEERQFTVGQIKPLDGTSLIAIEIAALDSGVAVSKGYGSDQRNLLLLDRSTGRSRRILPDNTRQIRELRFLPDDNEPANTPAKERRPARYYVFERVDPARPERTRDLLVGLLAAGEPSAILSGIDGIDHLEMLDDDHASVIVRTKGQLRFKILDLQTRKVTEDHPIDIG